MEGNKWNRKEQKTPYQQCTTDVAASWRLEFHDNENKKQQKLHEKCKLELTSHIICPIEGQESYWRRQKQ